MTLNNGTEIKSAIRRAVSSVAFQWPDVIEQDDLEQELWVWYLERPSAQAKLGAADKSERHKLLVRQGHLIASRKNQENLRFAQEFTYTIDDVKNVLAGKDRRDDSLDDLDEAMNLLRERNADYAEAIKSKYGDHLTPSGRTESNRLYQAHLVLTDLMNQVYRDKASGFVAFPGMTLGDGPGSRKAISNSTAQSLTGL